MSKTSTKMLSASRIKTLETCSWSYWCNYHLKMPQRGNSGAMRGTLCHLVFELLLKPRHRHHYKKILKYNSLEGSPAVQRLVTKHLIRDGIYEDGESRDLCDKMIVVGLQNEFLGKEDDVITGIEEKFIIKNEDPTYKIIGYMDKLVSTEETGKLKIVDYKSSKYKFKGEELDSNIQAMMYTLAAKKLWPKYKDIIVEFLFLRFPKQPAQQIEVSEEQLKGFEHYLEHMYNVVNNLSEKDAQTNFAKDSDDRRWLCKAGKTWRCPYLDPFEYYALYNDTGEITKTAFEESDLKAKKDQRIEKLRYAGCPAHASTCKGTKDDFDF